MASSEGNNFCGWMLTWEYAKSVTVVWDLSEIRGVSGQVALTACTAAT